MDDPPRRSTSMWPQPPPEGATVDADYVLFEHRNAAPVWSISARRARALRQWEILRADHEYQAAEESLRSWHPQGAEHAARLRSVADLPCEIRVAAGECISSLPPLVLSRDEQRFALHTRMPGLVDPLLNALVDTDTNAVLRQLQPYDPVSWHCTNRVAQQNWFIQKQDRSGGPWT